LTAETGAEAVHAKRRRISRAVPLSIILIVSGIWLGWSWQNLYWARRDAHTAGGNYSIGMRLCLLELELRAAAVRKYAARTGDLPASLSDCADDVINIEDWLLWARDVYKYPDAAYETAWLAEHYQHVITEPWAPAELVPEHSDRARTIDVARPPAELDIFGLPIIYERRAKEDNDGSWVFSADGFSPEIEKFLLTRGGVPAASAKPFALGSVFVRGKIEELQVGYRKARRALYLLLGGSLLIIVASVLILWKPDYRFVRLPGAVAVFFSGLIGVVAVFFGWAATQATCYIPSHFISGYLSRQERITLLEDAVRRGEVPADVAKTAREYIEKLPEYSLW
jgi:hypothetical protein